MRPVDSCWLCNARKTDNDEHYLHPELKKSCKHYQLAQTDGRETHEMLMVRTLELENVRLPTSILRHFFKARVSREQHEFFVDIPRGSFFPQKAQQAFVAGAEDECAFRLLSIDGVRVSAAEGSTCFEGEKSLRVGERSGHRGLGSSTPNMHTLISTARQA